MHTQTALKPRLLATTLLVLAAANAPAQHDAHRSAVREIARGQYAAAQSRLDAVLEDVSKVRDGGKPYQRSQETMRREGGEYARFVTPETHFALALLESRRGDGGRALEHARRACAAGLPFDRLLANPDGALDALHAHGEFAGWRAKEGRILLHGPMLGQVTHQSAAFWVRTAGEAEVGIELEAAGGQPAVVASGKTSAAADHTAVVRVTGLKPSTRYAYRVRINGRPVALEGTSFLTAPAPGTPGKFRVAFGGGAGFVPENERMWDTIAKCDPQALLLLGDNVYSDDPEHRLTQQYCYYRRHSRPEWRRLVAGRGVYAIWDDHDFGLDDCHGGPEVDEPAWKRRVWEVFTWNWNNPAYGGGRERPGCWFDFQHGDVHVMMLDGRYYREASGRHGEGAANPSMLGPVQREWLLDKLQTSAATFKVIASPVPWARGTKGGPPGGLDTWDGYSRERDAILDFPGAGSISGLLLLSADRHRSDIRRFKRQHGYELYDFMSSILTNYHTHPLMEKAPGWVFGYNLTNSLGLLDFDTTQGPPKVTLGIVNIEGETVWTRELTLDDLRDR